MSIAQSSRCLFCKWASVTPRSPLGGAAQRQFHSTPSNAKRRPAFQNIRAVDFHVITKNRTGSKKTPKRNAGPPKGQPTNALSATIPETLSSDRSSEDAESSPQPKDGAEAESLSGSLGMITGSTRDAGGDAAMTLLRQAREQARSQREALDTYVGEASQVLEQYTPREQQLLALKYSPEQLRALEAAEAAIDPKDLMRQGRMRDDKLRIEYKDDFSKILPLIDFPTRAPDADIDPGIRPLSAKETKARFAEWVQRLAERHNDDAIADEENMDGREVRLEDMKSGIAAGIYPGDGLSPEERMAKLRAWAQKREGVDNAVEFERFASDPSNFFHSPRGLLHSQSSALSDPIPRLEDPRIITEMESDEPAYERLKLQTGVDAEQLRTLTQKILVSHGVTNQTRMGKVHSQYYLAVAGDGNGMLGIGEGKGTEGAAAALKARINAIRNMRPIPRYEERTIFGEVEGKVGASIVKLSARPPGKPLPPSSLITLTTTGFGNRCQFLIFEMARAAGIKDLSARCLRSRNKMNVVKAAYAALMAQKLPEDVARARGRKMVDVRKVYYEGDAA